MPLIMHKGQNFSGWGTSDIYNNYLGSFIDLNNVIQQRIDMVGNSTYTYTATEDCCVIYYVWANNPNNNDYSYIQIENETVDMSFQTGGIQCVLNDVKYLAKGQTMTFKTGTITTGNPCYYTVYGVQKSNYDIGIFASDGVSEYTVYPVIYSSEEREVGVWKNGKPLYQKTLEFTINTSGSGGGISFYDPIPDLDEVIYTEYSIDGIGERTYSSYTAASETSFSYVGRGRNSVDFATDGSYYNGKKVYFTNRYTKTTDQPGSGSYTPQGVPAVHYSLNEQVIGTWIDGKTLYQKTWELTIPNASGTYLFNESVPNLETVAKSDYTFAGKGPRGYTPWYNNATILFSEQTDSHIEFYFASNTYAGGKIIYTSQYTKSS